jgi:hypothetical protein
MGGEMGSMETPLVVGIGMLAVILVLSNLYILRKLRGLHSLSSRTDERVHRSFRHLFRQTQILDGSKEGDVVPALRMGTTPSARRQKR